MTGRCRRNRCPRRCRSSSSGPVRMQARYGPYGDGQRRDAGSSISSISRMKRSRHALARLRWYPQSPLFFCSLSQYARKPSSRASAGSRRRPRMRFTCRRDAAGSASPTGVTARLVAVAFTVALYIRAFAFDSAWQRERERERPERTVRCAPFGEFDLVGRLSYYARRSIGFEFFIR